MGFRWRLGVGFLLAAAIVPLWLSGRLNGALPPARRVVQKDFRVFDYFRGSQKLKAMLHGGEAEYLLNPIPMQGVDFQSYAESGETNLSAKAVNAFCDRTNRTAYSAGPVEFQISGGRFQLSGCGFQWSQTNTYLVVSNQVRSVLKGDLMRDTLPRP